MALQFTVTALSSALSPWIIRRLKAAEQEKISSLTFPILISYLSLSICLVALAPEAMNILAPPDYLDALPALVPIALSVPLSFASGVLTVILVYFGKGGYTALVSSIGSAICIILNYTLISYFGYLGAGLSLLICQAFVAFSEVYAIKKIGFKDALPFNKILLCCLIGFLGCVGVYMLRERFILRLFFLIIPAFVLLLCLVRIKDLVFEKRGKNPS